MTNFEYIKSKTIDELAKWLDNYGLQEHSPWSEWFDNNYCQKCDTIKQYVDCLGRDLEFSYCEFNDDKCRFFPELNEIPENKQIIEMWLESECEE